MQIANYVQLLHFLNPQRGSKEAKGSFPLLDGALSVLDLKKSAFEIRFFSLTSEPSVKDSGVSWSRINELLDDGWAV